MEQMNIYEMYYANNKKYGFFVQRDSWFSWVAKIIKIEGVNECEEIKGKPPYFKNQKVFAQFYQQKLDNYVNIRFAEIDNLDDFLKENFIYMDMKELSCPGNYSYDMIFK